MIMLTCGFGAGITPMVWSLIIGDADQYCKNIMYSLHSFVDDYMEAGSKKDALASQELTHTTICGRRPISEKECILPKNGDLGHSSQLY